MSRSLSLPSSNESAFFPKGLPTRSKVNSRRSTLGPCRTPYHTGDRRAHFSEHWFWGKSAQTQRIQAELELAARREVHVVIIGETGTGKEFISKELHRLHREQKGLTEAEAPLVAVNAGAIPEALAESILFGHERGAFTSARERQYGKFELARKGSLFLDEIQNLSLSIQNKLLRVLQSRELDRLGSKSSSKIECQVICASNIPLELLVEKGLFRKDLYYRLNICPIYLPALRHRKEDIEIIARGLLGRIRERHRTQASEVSPEVLEVLENHEWPGNIRELEHVLLYASLRSENKIESRHLPAHLTGELAHYLKNGSWSLYEERTLS